MKKCSTCGEEKPLDEFGARNNSEDGLTGQCKSCLNEKHQKYRDANREVVRKNSREYVRKHASKNASAAAKWRKKNPMAVVLQSSRNTAKRRGYAPCNANVGELLEAYDGKCDICGVPAEECTQRLQMDHCHSTGLFRGFLCGKCNKMLGLAGDSEEILINALHYIMNPVQKE